MAASMVLKLLDGPWGSLVPRVSMRAEVDVSTHVNPTVIIKIYCMLCTLHAFPALQPSEWGLQWLQKREVEGTRP